VRGVNFKKDWYIVIRTEKRECGREGRKKQAKEVPPETQGKYHKKDFSEKRHQRPSQRMATTRHGRKGRGGISSRSRGQSEFMWGLGIRSRELLTQRNPKKKNWKLRDHRLSEQRGEIKDRPNLSGYRVLEKSANIT